MRREIETLKTSTLPQLAHFWKEGKPEPVIPKISQARLADIVGTTRSRVSSFLNKFKKLGFITCNGNMDVHSSLLNIVCTTSMLSNRHR